MGVAIDAAGVSLGTITDKHGVEYAVSFGSRTYIVREGSGALVAAATLPAVFDLIPFVESNITAPSHRRRGIQSALYDLIERHRGVTLVPSPGWHSRADVAFWRRRGGEAAVKGLLTYG